MDADFKVPELKWPKGTKWVKLPSGRVVGEVQVSPELAADMLALNADNQRSKKPKAVARYALDMSRGDWTLTHQGVAFNRKGRLHDGQNRLAAVVASGCTIPFTVWLGAGADREMSVIDTNAPRSVSDAASVLNFDVARIDIATLNAAIRFGVVNGNEIVNGLTHTAKLALVKKYGDALANVATWFGNSKLAIKLGPAPVRAAVLCASLTLNHGSLSRFVRVYTEQEEPKPGEGAAKKFRAFLVSQPAGTMPRDVFLKTCRSVQHFYNREDPTKLVACADNPFPIDAN